ncbi:eIF4-gamma/eIF5/eIF2-epsilon domain-containing protein [Ditylenchus destructor]|uniref:Translation initiation factor eIF2B subunit epsilon n=1 Tax=Ditylenchus destructor TaxID=166010 RepID=A0AAD4N9J4_9BILA|nr:eIF4-gamma/eIF5/eIF2-epsilon domain-containing protein [Ditylenchus destructor]
MQHQNSEEFDVLIIADNFNPDVIPTTYNDRLWAMQKLAGFTLVEWCLEWVSWFDSPNVVLATRNMDEDTCENIEERWNFLFHEKLHVLPFKDCLNTNDILREVVSRNLLTRDFILIDNIATFCSSNLSDQLSSFKRRLVENKNNVLTLLYSPVVARECPLIALQSRTNKLVAYDSDRKDKVAVSKNFFTTDTMFRTDLSPCGIALCAFEFSSHFSGNYDIQTLDGIVHDILSNEEFLMQNIHVEVLNDVAAFCANDYPSLLKSNCLLLQRTAFPLTFDNILPYFKDFDRVGANSTIKNSLFGSDVNVGSGCSVEDSVFEDNVSLSDGVTVEKKCFIGSNVTIPPNTLLKSGSILQAIEPPASIQENHPDNGNAWHVTSEKVHGFYKWRIVKQHRRTGAARNDSLSSTSSVSKSISELNTTGEQLEPVDVVIQGNNSVFLAEAAETMQSILKLETYDSKPQIEKMKLEINASKLAYNVSTDDLSKNIFLAFIRISPDIRHSFAKFSELFKAWMPLWHNYYKRDAAKTQLLHAIEEYSLEDEKFLKIVPKFLLFLFNDVDFLSEEILLDWYNTLPLNSPMIEPLKQLIEWVQNAEESSDEDEED